MTSVSRNNNDSSAKGVINERLKKNVLQVAISFKGRVHKVIRKVRGVAG